MEFPTNLKDIGNPQLREKLGKLNVADPFFLCDIARTNIESLNYEIPHSLECLAAIDRADRKTWDFNCHAYSLGFHERNKFWNARPKKDERLPESAFMQKLIDKGVLKPRCSKHVQDGDIAIYFSGSKLKHSGVVVGARIRSKWGNLHRWDHEIADVPIEYGCTTKFYELPEQDVLERFLDCVEP